MCIYIDVIKIDLTYPYLVLSVPIRPLLNQKIDHVGVFVGHVVQRGFAQLYIFVHEKYY